MCQITAWAFSGDIVFSQLKVNGIIQRQSTYLESQLEMSCIVICLVLTN